MPAANRRPSPVRTSHSDPLYVSWLTTGADVRQGYFGSRRTDRDRPAYVRPAGRLGLTLMPGKRAPGHRNEWHRSLDADLNRLAGLGATHLVCLATNEELHAFGVSDLRGQAAARGLEFLQSPILDGAAPTRFEETAELVRHLANLVREGSTVVVHCRGGLGRSGLVGAATLLELGCVGSAAEAITCTRARRPGTIENRAQERFVRGIARRLGLPVRAHLELLASVRRPERPEHARADATRGAVLGLAVGDALGAPFEFQSAQEIAASHGAVRAMVAGGVWEVGESTDDTALTLAAAEAYRRGGFEPGRACEAMVRWLADGPKDVGVLTRAAIELMGSGDGDPFDAGERVRRGMRRRTAGNGSLMRALPTALRRRPGARLVGESEALSALTHADRRCTAACAAFNTAVSAVVRWGATPLQAVALAANVARPRHHAVAALCDAVVRGEEAEFADAPMGFVLLTLERALRAFRDASSFERGVAEVVEMGGDADTNAAVAGALLGARFGASEIPMGWLEALRDRQKLEDVAGWLGAEPKVESQGVDRAVRWPAALTLGPARRLVADLAVFPLLGVEREARCVSLAQAQEEGRVVIGEQSDGPQVARVEVEVKSDLPVLLLEGELLEGARQNRVVDMTLLLGQGTHSVAVSCVEQGRWHVKDDNPRRYRRPSPRSRAASEFVASRLGMPRSIRRARQRRATADAGVGRHRRSDQTGTWDGIATALREGGVNSRSSDLLDLYEEHWDRLGPAVEAAEPVQGQVGAVFAIGERIVGAEIVESPGLWGQVWRSVMSGYATEVAAGRRRGALCTPPPIDEAFAFLRRAESTVWQPSPTPGLGVHTVAAGGDVTGFQLRSGGRLCHVVALA